MNRRDKLPRWGSKPPCWYNGFSPNERIRTWQVQWFMMNNGLLPHKSNHECEVCGSTKNTTYNSYHCEDYLEPEDSTLLCRSCHALVHFRYGKNSTFRQRFSVYANAGNYMAQCALDWSMDPCVDYCTEGLERYGDTAWTFAHVFSDHELKRPFSCRSTASAGGTAGAASFVGKLRPPKLIGASFIATQSRSRPPSPSGARKRPALSLETKAAEPVEGEIPTAHEGVNFTHNRSSCRSGGPAGK